MLQSQSNKNIKNRIYLVGSLDNCNLFGYHLSIRCAKINGEEAHFPKWFAQWFTLPNNRLNFTLHTAYVISSTSSGLKLLIMINDYRQITRIEIKDVWYVSSKGDNSLILSFVFVTNFCNGSSLHSASGRHRHE